MPYLFAITGDVTHYTQKNLVTIINSILCEGLEDFLVQPLSVVELLTEGALLSELPLTDGQALAVSNALGVCSPVTYGHEEANAKVVDRLRNIIETAPEGVAYMVMAPWWPSLSLVLSQIPNLRIGKRYVLTGGDPARHGMVIGNYAPGFGEVVAVPGLAMALDRDLTPAQAEALARSSPAVRGFVNQLVQEIVSA